MVLYHDLTNGFIPAVVTAIHRDKVRRRPALALVAFVNGMHACSFGINKALYGEAEKRWIFRDEEPSPEAQLEKPRVPEPKLPDEDQEDDDE